MCLSRSALGILLALGVAVPAASQTWNLSTGIDAEVTGTSNANYGLASDPRADAIASAKPYVIMASGGGRLRVDGSAAVQAVTYANGSQASQLLPQADLKARLELVERLVFFEAGVTARQTTVNPFGPRPGGGSSANTLTTTQWRLSPYIEGAAGPDLRYVLRSDNTWTREHGTDLPIAIQGASSYFGHQVLQLERDPRPFGWRFVADRTETRYASSASLRPSAIVDAARLELNYAFGADFSAGVRGGAERDNYTAVRETRTLYGFQARWKPSPRTDLSAVWEDRQFGASWNAAFSHRMPLLAWGVRSSRDVSTTPQSLFDLPPANSVASALDAIFTTRFPDPIVRAQAVQDFIDRQGLPTSTFEPVTLYASRLSVATSNSATATLIGTRTTLSLSVFRLETKDLIDSVFASGTPAVNNLQYGASIGLSRSVTPTTALSATALWSRIHALGGFGDSETKESGLSLRIQSILASRTNGHVGLRARRLASNVAVTGREYAALVGLHHAF